MPYFKSTKKYINNKKKPVIVKSTYQAKNLIIKSVTFVLVKNTSNDN